jgi:hypothetical protein
VSRNHSFGHGMTSRPPPEFWRCLPLHIGGRVKRIHITRRVLSEAADVAGIGCVVGAVWSWNVAAGVLLLGAALILIGWVIDR